MTVHCQFCKKEVIRGVDSVEWKGHLETRHKSCYNEMSNLEIQYAHLKLGNTCKCCGSTKNIHAGHINFPEDKIKKAKSKKSGFTVWSGDSVTTPRFSKLIEEHAVIPICASCNVSMSNGSTCRIHDKYLGIWNYLPHLNDLEEGEDFK